MSERGVVLERELLRRRLEEEVERIVHRHLRDEIHLHAKLLGLFRKDQPSKIVRLRILLPVQEVLFRLNLERVADDRRAAMGGGTKPDYLGSEGDETIV